jgi:hypothetical protein
MTLLGKHQFGAIDEKRVTFIEKKIEADRKDFLQTLLEHNGFEVIISEEKRKSEEEPQLYTLGVTDMIFNPTTYIFERRLRTLDNHIVTQDFWNQKTTETSPQYWRSKK